jgi:hypothetical protein
VFDQYLRDTRIPVLEYRSAKSGLAYRWANCVPGFDLPVRVKLGASGAYQWLYPTTDWQTVKAKAGTTPAVDPNFYVTLRPAGNEAGEGGKK